MEHIASDERNRIVAQLRRWGGSVAEALLDPGLKFFHLNHLEGFIGYYVNGGCVVAVGDPVCESANRASFVKAFHQFCKNNKKNVVYLVASEEFAFWMRREEKAALIRFGDELVVDPFEDPRKRSGKKGIVLRGKVRQALKEGVIVREYHDNTPLLENELNMVAHSWLKHRKGPQIYISHVRLFADRLGKRWFYARQGSRLVGVCVLNLLEARQGWVLDRVMTVPDAPQGTSECIVVSLLDTLAREGCRYVTFGATPADTLDEIDGFSKWKAFLTRHTYSLSKKFFHLEGRRKYWEKFHPKRSPAYLVFKESRLGLHEIRGLMHALNVSSSKLNLS